MNIKKEENIILHRADLAEIIIAKSLQVKQEGAPELMYFFARNRFVKVSSFLMLLIAFFAGFNSSAKQNQQQAFNHFSVIETNYYSNMEIL